MDYSSLKSKLDYVTELLKDIRHHHQSNTHACTCEVCLRKQSLLTCSISTALQEVCYVSLALDTASDGHKFSHSTSPNPTLSHEPRLLSKKLINQTDGSKVDDAHINSNMAEQICPVTSGHIFTNQTTTDESISPSLLCSTQRDSGLHTLLNSESISPISNGEDVHLKDLMSPLQNTDAKSSTNEIRERNLKNVSLFQSFSEEINVNNDQIRQCPSPSGLHNPQFTAMGLPSNPVFPQPINPHSPFALTSPHYNHSSASPSPWPPNMFMPYPVFPFLPSPSYFQELEKCRRFSESYYRSLSHADCSRNQKMNETFSGFLNQTTSMTPATTGHSPGWMYTPSTIIEKTPDCVVQSLFNADSNTPSDTLAGTHEQAGLAVSLQVLAPVVEPTAETTVASSSAPGAICIAEETSKLTESHDLETGFSEMKLYETDAQQETPKHCFTIKNLNPSEDHKETISPAIMLESSKNEMLTNSKDSNGVISSGENSCCQLCDDSYDDPMWRPWEIKNNISRLLALSCDELSQAGDLESVETSPSGNSTDQRETSCSFQQKSFPDKINDKKPIQKSFSDCSLNKNMLKGQGKGECTGDLVMHSAQDSESNRNSLKNSKEINWQKDVTSQSSLDCLPVKCGETIIQSSSKGGRRSNVQTSTFKVRDSNAESSLKKDKAPKIKTSPKQYISDRNWNMKNSPKNGGKEDVGLCPQTNKAKSSAAKNSSADNKENHMVTKSKPSRHSDTNMNNSISSPSPQPNKLATRHASSTPSSQPDKLATRQACSTPSPQLNKIAARQASSTPSPPAAKLATSQASSTPSSQPDKPATRQASSTPSPQLNKIVKRPAHPTTTESKAKTSADQLRPRNTKFISGNSVSKNNQMQCGAPGEQIQPNKPRLKSGSSVQFKDVAWGAPAHLHNEGQESVKNLKCEKGKKQLQNDTKVSDKPSSREKRPETNEPVSKKPPCPENESKAPNNCTAREVSSMVPDSALSKVTGDVPSDMQKFTAKTSQKLNQSLPVRSKVLDKVKSGAGFNESYEANQSFPKMTKTPLSDVESCVSPGELDVVMNLHQISLTSAEHTPRNRRSIFGFSPPDIQHGQRSHEKGHDSDGNGSVDVRSVCDTSVSEYMSSIWQMLDATDVIGVAPTVQEVLFNCVTSCICVVDPQRGGKIISLNEAFQFLIGVHEKVVNQRLFRFIKVRGSPYNLGASLPQLFLLSDSTITKVSGKVVTCIDARGKESQVSVWTVPFSPQPKLTVCVVGLVQSLTANVSLDHRGSVLTQSATFDDGIDYWLTQTINNSDGFVPTLDLDLSKVNVHQHTELLTEDGCTLPLTVTLLDCLDIGNDGEPLFPAGITVSTERAGLMVVQADGQIRALDKHFFHIHLGLHRLQDKAKFYDLLSEVLKVGQGSSQTSQERSPRSQQHKNSADSDSLLPNVSYLKDSKVTRADLPETKDKLFIPYSRLSRKSEDENIENLEDDDITSSSKEEDCDGILTGHLAPQKTSTPCKPSPCKQKPPSFNNLLLNDVCQVRGKMLGSGIYTGLFRHSNGSQIPVTFKLSRVETCPNCWLFCLWFYIQPTSPDDSTTSDEDEEDDLVSEEEEEEVSCDEEELRRRMKNLHFDQSVDASLGQAGLNQSQNAASGEDMLDLEAAMAGKFSKKYIVCETLGQGSFGFVRRAQSVDSSKSVVVKFINKSKMFDDSWVYDSESERRIPMEVAMLRDLDCDFIIKLLAVYENPNFVQMVMEDFGEIDMFDFIDQACIDEPMACHLFRQIIWAVEYLHSHGIIHRDIKDENVIINSQFQCKLIDFGSSAYVLPQGKQYTKFRGTMEYCSPEVWNGEGYLGPEQDVWALGITLFTIVFRENPFTVETGPGELLPEHLPGPISEDLMTLMFGLLKTDPKLRYSLRQALASDWLRQIVDISNYTWTEMFGEKYDQVDIENFSI